LFRGTTILAVKMNDQGAIAGDGQVTFGEKTIMKQAAVKVRRIKSDVLAGFAGGAADALTLFEKFEARLEQFQGNLLRAAVEMAKDWRTDKALRRLEALMVVMNRDYLLLLSGTGEIIEPDDGLIAIGSGGAYALAAARALKANTQMSAEEIARESLRIASSICVFTNDNITVEEL
jgi:ATP-dependent HslUV protease subunit HslV